MRPLELTVTGLRSYRTTTTVTFPDDWRLAAVVGPTGAGKSSLLEAVVYALFGSGTVPGASQPTNLITDDSREMRVVFRFAVGPEEFEIARTYRRVGNVQPVLTSAARTYTGARDVEEAVTRLLGLRQEAFCSTVLLPQGQFATLLQAAGAVQKETLDAFFRLAEVNELSDRLVAAAGTLAGRRKDVQTIRDQLPPDPAGEAQQAERRLEEAEGRLDAADKLAEVVARHERDASAEARRAETARQREVELVRAAGDLDGVAARALGLEALAIEIASAEQALSERTKVASAEVRKARETLSYLDGPGVEATAARVHALQERIREASAARDQACSAAADAERARAELELIRSEHGRLVEQREQVRAAYERSLDAKANASDRFDRLRNLVDEATRSARASEAAEARRTAAARELEVARTSEDQARQRFAQAVAKLTTAEAAVTVAREVLTDAKTKAVAATQRAEHIGRLRRDVDERRSLRDRLREALTVNRLGLEEARTLADQAVRAESEVEVRWRHAHAVGQEARREDAAAAAAIGCGAGDPCPVCARELPESFVPPAPSTRASDAGAAEQTLHDELVACRRATVRAEANLEARAREENSGAVQLSDAETALADAERQLASEDEASLEDVIAAADVARARLEDAHRAERAVSDSLAQARADVGAIERTIEPFTATAQRAAAALKAATTDWDEAAENCERSRGAFVEAGGDAALVTAQTDLTAATQTLANSKGPLDASEHALDDAEARLSSTEQRAAALGAAANSAASHNRRAADAVGNAVTTIPVEARGGASDDPVAIAQTAERWIAERRGLIAEAEQRQIEAETAFDQAERAALALRARRLAELDRPLADARSAGTRVATTAEALSPAADLGPAGLAAWATAAAAETRQRAEDRRREAEAADAEADKARAAAREACVRISAIVISQIAPS
ncbi:MAG: AAA family ATPase [Candidatus Rokuibacteriota bacterium]